MLTIEMLGVRGSIPVSGKRFALFGTGTTCVRINAGNQEIYVDAGTGIGTVSTNNQTKITILFSHPHLDHLMGLPFFSGLIELDRPISMGIRRRDGFGLRKVVQEIFRPPYWPIGIGDLPAKVEIFDVEHEFCIGDVRVFEMEGNHPGGCSVFRFNYEDHSVVLATDYEHTDEKNTELIRFSEGADLLIYDGQYTAEEYPRYQGYGHSTPDVGIEIARAAGVGRLVITHHSPYHDDQFLQKMEEDAQTIWPNVQFARGDDIYMFD